MPDNISRAVFDALWPEGSAWNIEVGGDLDLLFDGMADNVEVVTDFLQCLPCVRNPQKTPILSDLEREYGKKTDDRLTEQERRDSLSALIHQGDNNGSKDDLQNALNAAGFGVQVHENSPAVDPDIFLNNVPFMVADGDNAYAGFFPTTPGVYTSIAGKTGGLLLVNGKIFLQVRLYTTVAGLLYMVAGNDDAHSGHYEELVQELFTYEIPNDPASWPFFFFVGGDATRNVSGELTAIDVVDIDVKRQGEFESLILKFKPIHTWAGLMVNYK